MLEETSVPIWAAMRLDCTNHQRCCVLVSAVSQRWKRRFRKSWGQPKRMDYNGKSHRNGWFRGTPISGNLQIIQVLDHVEAIMMAWGFILRSPVHFNLRPVRRYVVAAHDPAQARRSWPNDWWNERSQYMGCVQNTFEPFWWKMPWKMESVFCVQLPACRYGRALTITVLEPDYSQERTLHALWSSFKTTSRLLVHWVPKTNFHAEELRSFVSIERLTSYVMAEQVAWTQDWQGQWTDQQKTRGMHQTMVFLT